MHIRLAVFIAGEFAPLIIWQTGVFISDRIQPVKMVVVTDSVPSQQSIADYGDASQITAMQNPRELDDGIEELTEAAIPLEDFAKITRPRNGQNRRT